MAFHQNSAKFIFGSVGVWNGIFDIRDGVFSIWDIAVTTATNEDLNEGGGGVEVSF